MVWRCTAEISITATTAMPEVQAPSPGYMYVCAIDPNGASRARLEILRCARLLSTPMEGSPRSARSFWRSPPTPSDECSPVTEVYNPTGGTRRNPYRFDVLQRSGQQLPMRDRSGDRDRRLHERCPFRRMPHVVQCHGRHHSASRRVLGARHGWFRSVPPCGWGHERNHSR